MGISLAGKGRPRDKPTGTFREATDGGLHAAPALDRGSAAAPRVPRAGRRGPGTRTLGLPAAGGTPPESGGPRAHRGPAARRGVDLPAGRRAGGAGGAPPED